MKFKHPEPSGTNHKIVPVFIPFAGCKTRCVFCSQEQQTGYKERELTQALNAAMPHIEGHNGLRPLEVAFYGGTFTALPQAAQSEALNWVYGLKKRGKVQFARCSTRPDAISIEILQRLEQTGINAVELGIQSFDDAALAAAKRGYSSKTALQACALIKNSPLELGVQLMPGMPGVDSAVFFSDVQTTAALQPATARLYPCMVFRSTPLAQLWEAGSFEPWEMQTVLATLPSAILQLWKHGVKVIRIGLAPQDGLKEHTLAGPWHPALGQELRSLALYRLIEGKLTAHPIKTDETFFAPQRFQGEFFGHKGSLNEIYAQIGISRQNISWWNEDFFQYTPA